MNAKALLSISLYLAVGMIAASCKKDSNAPSGPPYIYVAGYSSNGSNNVATYWKNGQRVALPSPDGGPGNATSIALSGSDVYVAGSSSKTMSGPSVTASFEATYWKNGQAVSLPVANTWSAISALALAGSDIYLAGYTTPSTLNGLSPTALYWKDGTNAKLNYPLTDTNGQVTSIALSGADVYMGGYDLPLRAVYWKNGFPVPLNFAGINGIAVSGSDVYAVGFDNAYGPGGISLGGFDAVYWKNGAITDLGNGVANAIVVSGTDVYIAGYLNINSQQVAVYWKNGVPAILQKGQAFAIAVIGSDVYTAGNSWGPTNNGNLVATYWKNSSPVYLNSGYSLSAITIGN
jgi:hypothetical protein